jgi:polyisoprenoid-binding protein YceI
MNRRIVKLAGILGVVAVAGYSRTLAGQAKPVAGPPSSSARSPREANASSEPVAVRLTVGPAGNEVRYRIREQLVGFDLPNDAIGKTGAVTGEIALSAAGLVVAPTSRFTVDVTGLTSDQSRRDNYVRRNILGTTEHPTVVFEATSIRGVSGALPRSGSKPLEILGNLTVRGTTKPATWIGTAQFAGDTVSGTAHTAFTFADFGLTRPRVQMVLSVADTIKLEYDFTLVVKK